MSDFLLQPSDDICLYFDLRMEISIKHVGFQFLFAAWSWIVCLDFKSGSLAGYEVRVYSPAPNKVTFYELSSDAAFSECVEEEMDGKFVKV